MTDRGRDNPPTDLYRELLEREARLERLMEELLRSDRSRAAPASSARLAPTAGPDGRIRLTTREAQILRLLATGRTNQQIGAELHLRAGTVRNCLGRVYRKLGVTTRTQAAVRAIDLELIRSEGTNPDEASGPAQTG